MRAWLTYAAAALVVTLAGAALVGAAVADADAGAVWFGAAVAYAIQLVAFAALVAVREKQSLFLAGWLAGLVLRFAVVGVVAYWLSRSGQYPRAAALLSLVGFVFVLLLMEPVFLRRGLQTR